MEPIDAMLSLPRDLMLRNDPAGAVRRLREDARPDRPDKLEEIAKSFEGVFLQQLVKQMKEASAELECESEDTSAEHIKGMYWDFWADALTERGGFGLWKQIYSQLAEQAGDTPSAAAGPGLDETT